MIYRFIFAFAFMVFSFLVSLPQAHARVFDIGAEHFAPFFKLTSGPSRILDSAFSKSSGANVSWEEQKVTQNYSVEIGFAISFPTVAFRFGVESFSPKSLLAVNGVDASGTTLYTLRSEIGGYAPTAAIEMVFWRNKESRFFIAGSSGRSTLVLQNSYTFTTPGTTAFGLQDFVEKSQGTGSSSAASFNFETNLSDDTTLWFEAGFRTLTLDKLEHLKAATTFNGTVAIADRATNSDGTDRSLDLGGYYGGIGFRFYVDAR